jgi:putative flippase GtrA
LKKSLVKEILKYGIVGVFNTIVSFCVIYSMITLLGFNMYISNFAGFLAGFTSSFFLNRNWTFRSEGSMKKESIGFTIVSFVSYGINISLIWVLAHIPGFLDWSSDFAKSITPLAIIDILTIPRFTRLTMPEMMAQYYGIVIFSSLNFTFNKLITFNKNEESKLANIFGFLK